MRRLAILVLAVVAFGATFIGAKTARAERWIASGWAPAGHYFPVAIPGGFTTIVDINDSAAVLSTISQSYSGLIGNSLFGNMTGLCINNGKSCPTTHWALTLCSDNSVVSGPVTPDYTNTNPSVQPTYSNTQNDSGPFAGYWDSSGNPTINNNPGYCPNGLRWSAGGVWMYEFGPW